VSYRVLILEDVKAANQYQQSTFTQHVAFDLGEDDRGAEVARLIAESHRKRVARAGEPT
jgi:hypothetical protein